MRVLSGIQPSGKLHIGNYFGAMHQYIEMHDKGNECFFFIANYHALTSTTDKNAIVEYTNEVARGYLSIGLDPEKATFFRQSDVPEVCELAWVLSCVTPMGLLERCVSYKDKIAQGITPNHGLFCYPVLQAADILIYKSDSVPVGQDQKQHLELSRSIATKFNNTYEQDVFIIPEPYIKADVAVVPGVDGRKMSKSYNNTIALFETDKKTKKSIMKVETDSTPMEDPKEYENCNAYALLKLVASNEELSQWQDKYKAGGMGYGHVKVRLAELINERFAPYRERYNALEKDPDYVEDVLRESGKKARAIAQETMEKVRAATGILTATQ